MITARTRDTWADPRGTGIQQETGLTSRQIVFQAKRLGLRTRKIYGRIWIHADDVEKLAQARAGAHVAPPLLEE